MAWKFEFNKTITTRNKGNEITTIKLSVYNFGISIVILPGHTKWSLPGHTILDD